MQSWNRQNNNSHEDIFNRMEKSDMFWYYDFSFVLSYLSQNMWFFDPSHLMNFLTWNSWQSLVALEALQGFEAVVVVVVGIFSTRVFNDFQLFLVKCV